eukprot:1692941-Rhodomonas_salina.1
MPDHLNLRARAGTHTIPAHLTPKCSAPPPAASAESIPAATAHDASARHAIVTRWSRYGHAMVTIWSRYGHAMATSWSR